MKKCYFALIFAFFSIVTLSQPLTGVKTIDNTGAGTYISFTAAINDLNSQGVGSGGVTFNVIAGQTFNELPPVINATGTSSDPIVFQKFGPGSNPIIKPDIPGTLTTTSLGNNADGIIVINGGDYITFNGIDLDGNSSYADATTKYEYGYYTKKASATDACKNLVIRNSTITLFHNTGTVVGIGSGIFISNISGTATITVTSTGGRSENIKIYGNTITGAYIGIQLRGYIHASPYDFYDQNIEVGVDGANSVSNYGGGTVTAYGIYTIYQNNLKIANSTFISASTATTLYGIFTSTAINANTDIYNNSVTITGGGTSSTIYAINNAAGGTGTTNTVNIYGNTITGCSYPTSTSGTVYLLYQSASSFKSNVYSNTITNSNIPGTGSLYILYISGSVVDTVRVYDNLITDLTKTSTGTIYGIYNSPASTAKVYVYNNQMHGISSGGGTMHGFYSSAGAEVNFYQNKIYDLTSTGASGAVNGISLAGGPLLSNVYNNLIGDLKAPATSLTTDGVRGISITSTTANSTNNISFNTIYINASSSGTNFSTSGIYHTTSATATTSVLNSRSNIFLNTSTANGTGVTSAYRRSSTTLTNFGSASNNNLYYAGTPGATNVIFYDGTNKDELLQDYKTRVSTIDNAAISENIIAKFLSTTGSSVNFLHMNPSIPTQVESGGIAVAGINTDYDIETRNNPPDIGADEFTGIAADLTPPVIIYTSLSNSSSTSGSRSITANITDPSGVVTGTNGPRLYYRKSTDPSFIFDNSPVISGSDFTFSLNLNLLSGITTGTVIEYYFAAQDSAGNSGTVPSGGSGINPPGTTPPGTPDSFTIVPVLSGTINVGTGETYTNLTAIANLLKPTNSEVTGNVIFELTGTYDGTTETVPVVFEQFNASNSSFTVTIRPKSSVTGVVTSGDPGSNFAFPVINIVGGDNYIFDGRPGGVGSSNEWTIRNIRTTATIGCVIRFADDANNNILRNLNIEGSATLTTTAMVFFHTTAIAITGNSNNSIIYNNISSRSDIAGTMAQGIYSNGTAAAPNSNNTVSNNSIYNFTGAGVNLGATGNGSGWVITNNYIGGSGPLAAGSVSTTTATVTGILCAGGTAAINNNTIGNIRQVTTSTSARIRGINQSSTGLGSTINYNTIFNITTTSLASGLAFGNPVIAGISVAPNGVFVNTSVNNNIIYNIALDTVAAGITGSVSAGILVYNLQNTTVANNKIYDIANRRVGTTANNYFQAAGIWCSFFSSSVVVNNMISLGNTETSNTQFSGIVQAGVGTGGNQHYYYFNTVSISGTTTGDLNSFGFLRGYDTTATQNHYATLTNNIFHMTRQGGASINYAIGNKGAANSVGFNSNYNILYNANSIGAGFWNATGYDLAGWQTASVGDANSKSKLVNFTNIVNGDLHLTGASNGDMDLAGTPISGITTDFDGNTRNESAPYMGADEAATPLPVELNTFIVTAKGRDAVLNWETKTEINSSSFVIERIMNQEWIAVSEVKAAGNSNSPLKYSYSDKKLNSGNYSYRLKMIDMDGSVKYSPVVQTEISVPKEYTLSQNYPNPFNPSTRIDYSLPVDSKVRIELYSITGERVTELVNLEQSAGYYTFDMNSSTIGKNLASGVYIYRMSATGKVNGSNFINVKKMVMLK